MGLNFAELTITIFLSLFHFTRCSKNIPACDQAILEPCPGDNIVCNDHNVCECDTKFSWNGKECATSEPASTLIPDPTATADSSDDTPHHHGATLVVALVFTLVLLMCALVLIFKKYKLMNYIRQKINARRSNDVIYEDVMIGQDDPPISL